MKADKTKNPTFNKILPRILVIMGGIGFLASFLITIEKIALINNPSHQAACDLNPLISCTSVMKTPQAEVFGFPNPLIGIAGFAVILTIGMALLAGASFKRWFWLGLEAGTIFGVGFIHWLFYQSVYVIGALCPYCIIVWITMIPIFIYTTFYNIQTGHLPIPTPLRKTTNIILQYPATLTILWYWTIAAAILIQFRHFFLTLIL